MSDAKEARKSVFYATGFMGYFYILTFIIGFGAIMLVGANPAFKDAAGQLIGGNNMAAVHLADAVGGNLFLGFISAVAFATILAVVAGLTLAGASAVSHDLYANVFRKGATERQELKVSKITVLILGVVAILLGILFENQNIAFMVGLAFSIAASCNFPIILLSMYWSKLTTRGGSRSRIPSGELSVAEKTQMPMNAMAMENSAGYSYGNSAFSWPRICTQMVTCTPTSSARARPSVRS